MIKIFPRMELKSCEDCPYCIEQYESCHADFLRCHNENSDVYSIATTWHVAKMHKIGKLIPFPDKCPLKTKRRTK